MTQRILVALLALGVLASTNAFASRARLIVMGTGDPTGALVGASSGGSLYYDDAYNMFYNPAYVNDFKNWATIEKSNNTGTTNAAQAGFATGMGPVNMGLFMNRVEGVTGTWSAPGTAANMRPIDFTIGGDMGWKWGFGATYGSFKSGDLTNTNLDLRAGFAVQDFEPYLSFKAIGADKISGTAVDRKNKSMGAGFRYHYGEWTPYVAWNNNKKTETGSADYKENNWGIGLARNMKVADSARLVYTTGFFKTTAYRSIVPIHFAVEGDALSWMTLRAGVGYNLWDRSGDTSNTTATTGRMGATIHAGKADFDFAVGTADSVNSTGKESGNVDAQAFGLGTGLFTAANLTYRW